MKGVCPKCGYVFKSSNRTSQMNKLYWSCLNILESDTGYTKDELHDYFKHKFLGEKIAVFDEDFVHSRTTTTLTKDEFSKYLNDIRFFVLDKLNVSLPIE